MLNKVILAALIVANVITIAGIARADNTVQVCKLDKQGNLVQCVAQPITKLPGEARPEVHSHAPNGVTVRK